MKKKIILFFVILSFTNCTSNRDIKSLNNLDSINFSKASRKLNSALEEIYETTSPKGISASVIFPNNQIWSKAVGISSINDNLDEEMVMNIGSVTKTFTATLIMQLIEENKLTLNDTVDTLLPRLWNKLIREEDQNKRITVSELLNHTSGLYPANFILVLDFSYYSILVDFDLTRLIDEKIDEIINEYGQFTIKADRVFKYNNDGYFLLGLIIEELTQKKLSDVYQERIFNRINLKNTFLFDSNTDLQNIKFGHPWWELDSRKDTYSVFFQKAGKQNKIVEIFGNTDESVYSSDDASALLYNKYYQFAYSAGSIFSTATDLNIFMKSLFDYTLISEDSLKKMIQMNKDSSYGYGIRSNLLRQDGSCCIKVSNKDIKGSIQFYGHTGGNFGYHTRVVYSPEIELGIAVIINENKFVLEQCVRLLFKAVLDSL